MADAFLENGRLVDNIDNRWLTSNYTTTQLSQSRLPECYSKAAPFPSPVFIARMLCLPIYY